MPHHAGGVWGLARYAPHDHATQDTWCPHTSRHDSGTWCGVGGPHAPPRRWAVGACPVHGALTPRAMIVARGVGWGARMPHHAGGVWGLARYAPHDHAPRDTSYATRDTRYATRDTRRDARRAVHDASHTTRGSRLATRDPGDATTRDTAQIHAPAVGTQTRRACWRQVSGTLRGTPGGSCKRCTRSPVSRCCGLSGTPGRLLRYPAFGMGSDVTQTSGVANIYPPAA